MKETSKIAVIGSGSWGSALSNMLASNGVDTTLYVRKKELFEQITKNRENTLYLPNIKLSNNLKIANSIEETLKENEIIILSVPVKYLRNVLNTLKPFVNNNHIFISSSKGIENGTFFRPSEIINNVIGIENKRFAVISGPNFAKEVAKKLPTATVIASNNNSLMRRLQNIFSCRYFRAYGSNDVVGVEIAGALKNVIAIAAGLSDGLNFGNNAKASLITRGLAEISRLGLFCGAKKETFMGLAGIGDLVLTCTGNLSRNRHLGIELSKNKKADDIINSMVMVAEGVNTAKSVFHWSKKYNVDMPISHQVYNIIYENKDPKQAAIELMERPLKKET